MKKILIALLAILGLLLGSTPAIAGNKSVEVPQSVFITQAQTGAKMGALPYHYQICVANGIEGYNSEWVLEKWTQASYGALQLVVRNRCYEDYSITNRMTVDSYSSPNGGCAIFQQNGRYWDAAQGYYVFNQNPIIWLNTRDSCVPNDTAFAHRLAMYVGAFLGIEYWSSSNITAVMCNTTWCINNIKYVQNWDLQQAAGIYGLAA